MRGVSMVLLVLCGGSGCCCRSVPAGSSGSEGTEPVRTQEPATGAIPWVTYHTEYKAPWDWHERRLSKEEQEQYLILIKKAQKDYNQVEKRELVLDSMYRRKESTVILVFTVKGKDDAVVGYAYDCGARRFIHKFGIPMS